MPCRASWIGKYTSSERERHLSLQGQYDKQLRCTSSERSLYCYCSIQQLRVNIACLCLCLFLFHASVKQIMKMGK